MIIRFVDGKTVLTFEKGDYPDHKNKYGVRGLSKYGDRFRLSVIHKGKKYGFIVLNIESAKILRKRIDKSLENGTFEDLKKELMKR